MSSNLSLINEYIITFCLLASHEPNSTLNHSSQLTSNAHVMVPDASASRLQFELDESLMLQAMNGDLYSIAEVNKRAEFDYDYHPTTGSYETQAINLNLVRYLAAANVLTVVTSGLDSNGDADLDMETHESENFDINIGEPIDGKEFQIGSECDEKNLQMQ